MRMGLEIAAILQKLYPKQFEVSKMIELEPKSASGYIERGQTELAQINYDAAVNDLNKALELKGDEALVYKVCSELFRTRRLADATFNEAVTILGESGLTEVIAIIGYYTLIGNTLNVFEVAVPDGITPPFPE